MPSPELAERRASGYYRPDPNELPEGDVLPVPSISDVLDRLAYFEEAHADDGVGSEDADRHLDPHWMLYSLLAAVKRIEGENLRLVGAWEAGYAEGLRVCVKGRKP